MTDLYPWICPKWPAPQNIHALCTTRLGGVSGDPFDSFNLALHVGDNEQNVNANRKLLIEQAQLPQSPQWLSQTHSDIVIEVTQRFKSTPEADASYTFQRGRVLAVMTADCLPILLCNRQGNWVAAVHAGWRGLAAGILIKAVKAYTGDSKDVMAWFGPAISQTAFEVGEDVLSAFLSNWSSAKQHFLSKGAKYHADLYGLARMQLQSLGVEAFGGQHCTYHEKERFYSYRRDGETGRMASLIWIAQEN